MGKCIFLVFKNTFWSLKKILTIILYTMRENLHMVRIHVWPSYQQFAKIYLWCEDTVKTNRAILLLKAINVKTKSGQQQTK